MLRVFFCTRSIRVSVKPQLPFYTNTVAYEVTLSSLKGSLIRTHRTHTGQISTYCIWSPIAQFKLLFASVSASNQTAAVDSRGRGSDNDVVRRAVLCADDIDTSGEFISRAS